MAMWIQTTIAASLWLPSRAFLGSSYTAPLFRSGPMRRHVTPFASLGTNDPALTYSMPAQWLSPDREHNLKDMEEYQSLHRQSIEDPSTFWATMAAGFEWHGKSVAQGRFNYEIDPSKEVFAEWLRGSQTNIAYNALDRQIDLGRGDQVALLVERNIPEEGDGANDDQRPSSCTYSELREQVNRLGNSLKAKGVSKGDRVAVFMGHGAEAVIAMLACARIGAVHCVVFGGLSAEALAQRLVDCGAVCVVTQDGYMRGEKVISLKEIYDSAISIMKKQGGELGAATSLRTKIPAIVLKRLGDEALPLSSVSMGERDTWWHEELAACDAECETEWVDAEDPAFILYTSGSTGRPKGIVHAVGGFMVGAAVSFKYVFDLQPGDVWWCTADVGWVTGHTYVTYGPLLNGATQVLFEGSLFHPTAARAWEIVDKYEVSHLYTAPTFIRSCMSAGSDLVQESSSRESLRLLGSVGEPINPEAWEFYFEVIGNSNCPIVDTWWQTETGHIMLTPMPVHGSPPLSPGAASLPFFGADPAILDPVNGLELEGECEGLLVLKSAWPSMLRGVWGDDKRFRDTYFKSVVKKTSGHGKGMGERREGGDEKGKGGVYVTGDRARRDHQGQYWITGRADDVMVVSGHNIGTAEVESAAVCHPLIGEAAVVGVPDKLKGTSMCLFVSLVERQEDSSATTLPSFPSSLDAGAGTSDEAADITCAEVKALVRDKLGSFAKPDTVHIVPPRGLPKTRSGKIMRRILRKVATLGKEARVEDMGDLSTLADPLAVEDLIASIAAATTSSSASRSDSTTNFKPLFRGPFPRANKA